MKAILTILIFIGLVISLPGCTSASTQPTAASSTTTTPSATSVTSSTTTQSTSASGTFGSMSQAGEAVYLASCASCHGSKRPLWGAAAQLSSYNSAQGLLGFISSTMPANAPGSLSHQDYLNVLSYILIQNNDVSSGMAFNESQLSGIALK